MTESARSGFHVVPRCGALRESCPSARWHCDCIECSDRVQAADWCTPKAERARAGHEELGAFWTASNVECRDRVVSTAGKSSARTITVVQVKTHLALLDNNNAFTKTTVSPNLFIVQITQLAEYCNFANKTRFLSQISQVRFVLNTLLLHFNAKQLTF